MVTIIVLQSSIVCAVQWGSQSMSAVDWRSEQDYANFEKAETADIAWEWLRRDSEYERDYQKPYQPLRNRMAAPRQFPAKMGVVFSQLIPNRRSTDNRFSGRLRLCRPSCRSVNSPRPAMSGQYALDLDHACRWRISPWARWLARNCTAGRRDPSALPARHTCQRGAAFNRIAARRQFRHPSAGGTPILVRHRRPPSWCISSCALSRASPALRFD